MNYFVRTAAQAQAARIDEPWGTLNWLASTPIGNAEGVTLGHVIIRGNAEYLGCNQYKRAVHTGYIDGSRLHHHRTIRIHFANGGSRSHKCRPTTNRPSLPKSTTQR